MTMMMMMDDGCLPKLEWRPSFFVLLVHIFSFSSFSFSLHLIKWIQGVCVDQENAYIYIYNLL